VDSFEGKSPLETPPWGRLLRRTRENAVILARTVSAPLGWRRKKSQKKSARSGPLVGLTGTRSSSTNCSSRGRCVPDWPNSAAANSGSSTNSRSRGSSGTCAVRPGGPSGAGQRAERALPEVAVAQNLGGCQWSVGSGQWAADAGEAEVQVAAAEELAGDLADDRPPGSVTRGVTLVVGALELEQVSFDQSIKGRDAQLARAIGGGGRTGHGDHGKESFSGGSGKTGTGRRLERMYRSLARVGRPGGRGGTGGGPVAGFQHAKGEQECRLEVWCKHPARYFLVESAEGVGSGVFSLCLSRPIGLIPFLFRVDPPRGRCEAFWSAVA
jgi:hypothetical protein